MIKSKGFPLNITELIDYQRRYILVPAAEIRDHETGLVSGHFSWFQSRQFFLETHETEANSISYS